MKKGFEEYLEQAQKEGKVTNYDLRKYKNNDKVKYLGKSKNGFETNGIYTVSRVLTDDVFETHVTIKNDSGKKLKTNRPQDLEKA